MLTHRLLKIKTYYLTILYKNVVWQAEKFFYLIDGLGI